MLILDERPAALELDGFTVGRVLPHVRRRMVGPFIFLDHMGPAVLVPGTGMDVRPHPHIGLATVTYLFDGEIVHRDSLGYTQPIRPGEINWMTAGRGIAHSERTSDELRASGSRLHGVQLWVALPQKHEEDEPSFHHYDADAIPSRGNLRLLAGNGYGMTSPVPALSPMIYAEVMLEEGETLELPDEHPELSVLILSGALNDLGAVKMMIFDRPSIAPKPRSSARSTARTSCSSAAPRSTASATSGGTSCTARKSASKRRSATGRKGGSRRSRATTRSTCRCRRGK